MRTESVYSWLACPQAGAGRRKPVCGVWMLVSFAEDIGSVNCKLRSSVWQLKKKTFPKFEYRNHLIVV